MEIILGSASPRRKTLLKEMGFQFSVQISQVDERYDPSMKAADIAPYLAKLKANALRDKIKSEQLLICCDTVVIDENTILGKPNSYQEAIETVQKLSGKNHEVMSAVSMLYKGKSINFSASTRITFKEFTESEIAFYIKNYEPYDKAGSYGIQEWIGHIGVLKIEGSYTNVMGLPTQKLYEEIQKLSV